MTAPGSEIRADGKFSLGYPRKDQGEEIDARVRLDRRPLADLRHAFQLDDYPMQGMVSGDFHLYGPYERPYGFGNLVIERGRRVRRELRTGDFVAPLRGERRTARLARHPQEQRQRDRRGVRRVGRRLFVQRRRHADSGRIARRPPHLPQAPLSGLLQFNATRRRHVRRAEVRRQAPRRRPVRRRRRHRAGERPSVAARRAAHAGDGSGLSPPGRVGLGPDRADAGDGHRADGTLRRHLAGPVRPLLRAAAVAVHQRRGRRHHPGRRRAGRRRSPGRRHARRESRPQAVRLPSAQQGPDRPVARSARAQGRPAGR